MQLVEFRIGGGQCEYALSTVVRVVYAERAGRHEVVSNEPIPEEPAPPGLWWNPGSGRDRLGVRIAERWSSEPWAERRCTLNSPSGLQFDGGRIDLRLDAVPSGKATGRPQCGLVVTCDDGWAIA